MKKINIGFFGKTNVGKSSLLNTISGQDISITSEVSGTTTDVVQKNMELLPIGPVCFFDTAGLDDHSSLAAKRIEKTIKILPQIDIAVIILDDKGIDHCEKNLIKKLTELQIPFFFIINKSDEKTISQEKVNELKTFCENILITSIFDKNLIDNFKKNILNVLPNDFINAPQIIGDLVPKNATIILVTPIDKQAPKDRLILPQVQTIRNLLDNYAICIVAKEEQLELALASLKEPPFLVITDSQAFKNVSKIVPENILLTSFSILFARLKGDLPQFIKGTQAIDNLQNNDKILILESCTHHATDDDIGKVKIPNLLKNKTGLNLAFEHYSGHDIPDLDGYKLIIHCGACMTNRKEMMSRLMIIEEANIPITNYGIIISYCLNILPRALRIFNIDV